MTYKLISFGVLDEAAFDVAADSYNKALYAWRQKDIARDNYLRAKADYDRCAAAKPTIQGFGASVTLDWSLVGGAKTSATPPPNWSVSKSNPFAVPTKADAPKQINLLNVSKIEDKSIVARCGNPPAYVPPPGAKPIPPRPENYQKRVVSDPIPANPIPANEKKPEGMSMATTGGILLLVLLVAAGGTYAIRRQYAK
jgi:hypothetical protein